MAITVTITHGAPNGTEEVRVACDLCSKVESVTFRASAVREPFDKARSLVVGPSSTEARDEAVRLLGESCPHVGDLQRMHSELSARLPYAPIRAQWASAFTSKDSLKPLTAEEIAELRRLDAAADPSPWGLPYFQPDAYGEVDAGHALAVAARNALPRLLDEVERSRGTDHPEQEEPNIGATALDTLNRAPFTPDGRFLHPRAYNQIHAELERSRRIPLADENDVRKLLGIIERCRALLKRIEWSGDRFGIDSDDRGCPACEGSMLTGGHAVNCELAALLGAAT